MERITKSGKGYVFTSCKLGSGNCEILDKYFKMYRRLSEYEDLEMTPKDILEMCRKYKLIKDKLKETEKRLATYEDIETDPMRLNFLKEELDRYKAIGLTPEEITYRLDHPEVETTLESVDIDVDDGDFKEALIKVFTAGFKAGLGTIMDKKRTRQGLHPISYRYP